MHVERPDDNLERLLGLKVPSSNEVTKQTHYKLSMGLVWRKALFLLGRNTD